MPIHSRRSFLAALPTGLALAHSRPAAAADSAALSPSFPTQDPELVREMVTVAHGNVARVKELVARHQTLAKAAWDWGFGDWESALGAASHVGNREIAEHLIANGARPTIFSAAMLGQLDAVKAFVAASPGVQRIKGPHSITLLRHASAGGAAAKPVLDYLTALGGADERIEQPPLTEAQRTRLAGVYASPLLGSDRIEVTIQKDVLMFGRTGRTPRGLIHVGNLEFAVVGAEQVRIAFAESAGGATVTVRDPGVVLVATKSA
jgi:hypothetical protein